MTDIDFLRRMIRVDRQLNDRREIAPLMTRASYRTLPHAAGGRRRAGRAPRPQRPERRTRLPGARRQAGATYHLHGRWRRALTDVDGPAGLRLHDLRHSYPSALIAAGESVKTVQVRMGHASAMVTLDVYGHLWPNSEERTRAASTHG